MENSPEKKSSTSFLDSINFIEKGVSSPPPTTNTPVDASISRVFEASTKTFLDSSLEAPQETSGEESTRVSSSQRMKYSAEVEIIKRKWGSLEDMRKRLSLSQRKMAQLLMVDPSAWTRWTKESGEAPPHIYRSLSWFLLLQEQHPEMRPQYWLSGVAQPSLPEQELTSIRNRLSAELKVRLEGDLRFSLEKRLLFWKWMMIGQFVALVILAGLCIHLVQKN